MLPVRFGATVKIDKNNIIDVYGWKKYGTLKKRADLLNTLLKRWPDEKVRVDIVNDLVRVHDLDSGDKYFSNRLNAHIRVVGSDQKIHATDVPQWKSFSLGVEQSLLGFVLKVARTANRFAKTHDVSRKK